MSDQQSTLQTIRVRIPAALEVFLLGEFNNWSTTATSMRAVDDEYWEVSVPKSADMKRPVFFVWRQGERFGHVWPRWVENREVPQVESLALAG